MRLEQVEKAVDEAIKHARERGQAIDFSIHFVIGWLSATDKRGKALAEKFRELAGIGRGGEA